MMKKKDSQIADFNKIQEALHTSELRYRRLFETAKDGILILDAETGKIVDVNPFLVDLLGYSHDQFISKAIWEIGFFKDIIANKDNFLQLKEKKYIRYEDLPLETADGRKIDVEFVSNVYQENQNYVIQCNIRDSTENKKLVEISQRNQKLEFLGVLAGGIAHDFNNLISGIFGYIDLAIRESTDDKVTQYLSRAINTMDRTRGLTRQLLTFAKGGAPVQIPTPLFPLIQDTVQFALSGSTVSCRYDLGKDLWPCNIDKDQICQVIDNIIINAQQAMPTGGIVEIAARNVSISDKEHQTLKKGDYVKVSIKDNGIGISEKMQLRIFDPFFTTKPKGHGLGLATCFSIIKRHGGVIEVESVVDKGSTFDIYLPSCAEPAASPAAMTDVRHIGSGRIIVMDDEEIIRDTFGRMLEALGYTVVCKNDGKEAVDFFIKETEAKREFAALFFDLTVTGGMGGKAAVEKIRKLNTTIPVFVASGYADDPVMRKPVEFGFTASIGKPFRMNELERMLEKYLKKHE